MPYAKALGTYKRINNIKRATDNIMEAQSIINEQRIKAANKARKAERHGDFISSVANIVSGAAGYGMGKSTSIDPDKARKVSAILGAVGSGASSIPSQSVDTTGMTYGEHAQFRDRNRSNIAEGAVAGYTLQDMIEGINKSKAFEDQSEMLADNEFGLSIEELSQYVDEVDWTENVGYDFSSLPEKANERIQEIRRKMNHIPSQEPERDPVEIPFFETSEQQTQNLSRRLKWQ